MPTPLWKPGQSGNPAGRPRGARNRTARAVGEIINASAEEIAHKLVERALEGDGVAMRLCMARVAPPPKGRSVDFVFPEIRTPADVVEAGNAVMAELAAGELTPAEAAELTTHLERYAKLVEVKDIDERLKRVEQNRKGERHEPEIDHATAQAGGTAAEAGAPDVLDHEPEEDVGGGP